MSDIKKMIFSAGEIQRIIRGETVLHRKVKYPESIESWFDNHPVNPDTGRIEANAFKASPGDTIIVKEAWNTEYGHKGYRYPDDKYVGRTRPTFKPPVCMPDGAARWMLKVVSSGIEPCGDKRTLHWFIGFAVYRVEYNCETHSWEQGDRYKGEYTGVRDAVDTVMSLHTDKIKTLKTWRDHLLSGWELAHGKSFVRRKESGSIHRNESRKEEHFEQLLLAIEEELWIGGQQVGENVPVRKEGRAEELDILRPWSYVKNKVYDASGVCDPAKYMWRKCRKNSVWQPFTKKSMVAAEIEYSEWDAVQKSLGNLAVARRGIENPDAFLWYLEAGVWFPFTEDIKSCGKHL